MCAVFSKFTIWKRKIISLFEKHTYFYNKQIFKKIYALFLEPHCLLSNTEAKKNKLNK